jgi:hypothetical protein
MPLHQVLTQLTNWLLLLPQRTNPAVLPQASALQLHV